MTDTSTTTGSQTDTPTTLVIYTPGSDYAQGFNPNNIIWGRTGNDVMLGFQPQTPPPQQYDVLAGDVAIDDPFLREWRDRYVLGDWDKPYYANGTGILGLNDAAVILDFNPQQDTIQLHGSAENYQLIELGDLGTAIVLQKETGPDVVGFALGATNLDLNANYFQYRGTTPPPGPVQPEVQQQGSSGFEIAFGSTTDPSGNVYTVGGTTGSIAGDSNGESRDALVTKYDPDGNLLFTKQFGTDRYDTISDIATDAQGNFYVAGITEGNLAGEKQGQVADAFLAKFDANGNQLWIRQFGRNLIYQTFAIDVDDSGNAYLSGIDVRSAARIEFATDDFWVRKFDTNGNPLWETVTGSLDDEFDETYTVAVADDGNVYAGGWTRGDLEGPGAGVDPPNSTVGYDAWITKFNNDGQRQWIRQFGTTDYEWTWGVATDSQGNVYATGWTLGSLFGQNAGSYDPWLVKYDSQGNRLWAKQFGGAGDDVAFRIDIDNQDRIFLSGYTDGNLGGANAGSYDAWAARYDVDGNQVWLKQFGTPDFEQSYGLAADNQGSVYVSGVTEGSFGDINAGSTDNWTAKLDANSGNFLNFSGNGEAGNGNGGADPAPLNGAGGQQTFNVAAGPTTTIENFGGVGTGNSPSAATIAEADTLRFNGPGLTAENLILTQIGENLLITFEGFANTRVLLKSFQLENLDNLIQATGASVDLGNILFNGQAGIQDSFDVVNANANVTELSNRNSVTFLNDLNNTVRGFDDSKDVINAQGGNDVVFGLSGDDTLRGGDGNDQLSGGIGQNRLKGDKGADTFVLSEGGVQMVQDFKLEEGDRIGLPAGLGFGRLSIAQGTGADAGNTLIRTTRNSQLLAVLSSTQANTITQTAFSTV